MYGRDKRNTRNGVNSVDDMAAYVEPNTDVLECDKKHAPRDMCHPTVIFIPQQVIDWAYTRVQSTVHPILSDPRKFYGYWNISNVLHNMKQSLECSMYTCLYIAVNDNNRKDKSKTRVYHGLNRNPVESIAYKNRRYEGKDKLAKQGWKLLAYAMFPKSKYKRTRISRIKNDIANTKKLDEKIVRLLKFCLIANEAVRVNSDMLCEKSVWHLPTVQQYLSKQISFVHYINETCTIERG